MSLQYYAQPFYLCAHCGAVLGYCGGQKNADGNLVVHMKCTHTGPSCPQYEKPMRITLLPLSAPEVTE